MLLRKGLLLILVFWASIDISQCFAQVPNFKMNDINGVEHDLYETLDEGKVVIVEVFATWCTTCWELHKKDYFQNLYSTYGPEGTNQLEIFFIEGDVSTPATNLYGEESFGDWTEDVSYPIFSPGEFSAEFLANFAAKGVPTSSIICPITKEKIADVYQNELSDIISIIQDCNTIQNVKDLQIIEPTANNVGICKPTELMFQVLNTGTETFTSLLLEATHDNGETFNTHTCEVNLASGELIDINLGEFQLPDLIESQVVHLNILTVDDVAANNTESIIYTHAESVQNEIYLRIEPDTWVEADRTRWWVENSNGEVVIPVTSIEENTLVEEVILLENTDCFTFVIADDYGDGLLFGKLELVTSEGVVLYDEVDFKYRGEASFEYLGAATRVQTLEETDGYSLELKATLLSNENLDLNFSLPFSQDIRLEVVDLQGSVISSFEVDGNEGINHFTIEMNNLGSGIFFVHLKADTGVLTEKFIKG